MNIETGKVISQEDYEALSDKDKEGHFKIPENMTQDTIDMLTRAEARVRRNMAVQSVQKKLFEVEVAKRRNKNKLARKARKAQRARG